MANPKPADLINRMRSDDDSARKMAVFKLQQVIGDPSFADIFIQEGGLSRLRSLCLYTSGNTMAYSLGSLNRLLDLDMGWEIVTEEMIEHLVEIVVNQPLVNMLRSSLSILVAIVSHPQSTNSQSGAFGFRALKPALANHPSFLEMLVARLTSADHALCANALSLINSLMRDSVAQEPETEWPKLIKRLQDLGVITAVYSLSQSSSLADIASPVLEFQYQTKLLLRKWRDTPLNLEKPEHRRALKALNLASNPPPKHSLTSPSFGMQDEQRNSVDPGETEHDKPLDPLKNSRNASRKHHPEKWRRLGFATESPSYEFDEVGFLGMMDLTDWVRKHDDVFQKLLLEQASKSVEQRCPIARASLAVTLVLYEHFEIDRGEGEDMPQRYLAMEGNRDALDHVFKPLLLQWSRLHTAGLAAFLRLWKETSAEEDDLGKIEDLVRILVEQVVGRASRIKDIGEVEDEMAEVELARLRELQMELLDLTYEDAWGHHLKQVRDELNHEALQFVKEQRIRCLLQGAWFPHAVNSRTDNGVSQLPLTLWRFVKLSHNRRFLHYADFESKASTDPSLGHLSQKIELSTITSVTSNISASAPSTASSDSTLKNQRIDYEKPYQRFEAKSAIANTQITIHGFAKTSGAPHHHQELASTRENGQSSQPSSHADSDTSHPHHPLSSHPPRSVTNAGQPELPLLTLHPTSHALASEFLDGLLMLLNQQPITSDTAKLVDLVAGYGFRIRLLNVRYEDLERAVAMREQGEALGDEGRKKGEWQMKMPSKEGVDEEFWYDIGTA
ncbi:MAG: hypothetical protein M1821_002964 [Bathelium mastoideum]|nr:MAG: hypothetical protein M1821_002964 [Bathelium mastoideum]